MEKLVACFLAVKRRPARAQVNLQKSLMVVEKHSTPATDRDPRRRKPIVPGKLVEARAGDGSKGETLARDPGATATP
jgi:hypothetical protein